MALHDQIRAWSQGDEGEGHRSGAEEGAGNEISEVPKVKFSNPADVLKSAQEMIVALQEKHPSVEPLEQPTFDMTPEEIEAERAEREAILQEIAQKMTGMQSSPKNREAQEIAQEAEENWDDALK